MSLKDALLKAGFKSTKNENERDFKPKREKKNSEKHQFSRNFCEHCCLTQPDVERFKHRNRLVDAQWICSNCADKLEILDDFRVTNQSQFANQGKYRRQYGHTKKFQKEGEKKPERKPRNKNHNRSQSQRRNSNNNNRSFNKKRSHER